MTINDEEIYTHIIAKLDDYLKNRKVVIDSANHYRKQILATTINYTQDKTYKKIVSVKEELTLFNKTIDNNITKFLKNSTFYESHRHHVLEMLRTTNENYLSKNLNVDGIVHTRLNENYTKTDDDFWNVILECTKIGGMITGFIPALLGACVGIIPGILMSIASMPAFRGDRDGAVAIFLIPVFICGIVPGIVGATVGALIGLLIAPLYYKYSVLPLGSMGRTIQEKGLFDYQLVKDLYLDLEQQDIKTLPTGSTQQRLSNTSSAQQLPSNVPSFFSTRSSSPTSDKTTLTFVSKPVHLST